MAATATQDTTEQVEALTRRARLIAADIAEAKAELDAILDKISDLVPVGWSDVVDGKPVVKRGPNRKFDTKVALSLFTAAEQKSCIERMVNEKKVREIAADKGITEDCMVEGTGNDRVVP